MTDAGLDWQPKPSGPCLPALHDASKVTGSRPVIGNAGSAAEEVSWVASATLVRFPGAGSTCHRGPAAACTQRSGVTKETR
jgi:hypothetical protein